VGYLRVHRGDLNLAVGAAVLGSAAQVVVPLVERHVVDTVVVGGDGSLTAWMVLLLALAGVVFGLAYVRRYHGGRLANTVQNDLRRDIHAHLQRLDQGALEQLPTGQLVARANSDTALVQGLLSLLPIMSGNVLLMVLSLVVMLFLSPLLALVSLLIAPALMAVSYRLRSQVFPASWDAQQREGDVIQVVDEDVSGVRVVKAFGQERRELARVARSAEVLYGAQLRAVRMQARYQPLLQAIPAFGQVAILALGGWLTLRGQLTLGTFLAFSTYVGQLLAPARQLAGVLTIGQQARAGVERIFQLLDLSPAITDGATTLVDVRGDLAFEDVRFGYGAPVLDGFTLHVRAGERVALVGPSGSGKTTALLLAQRFHDPGAGSVTLDGHDVRTLTLGSLRAAVGAVHEEAFLFSDSVRANIAYGKPDATLEQVVAAARVAQADGFIRDLPGGYDTVVGERGLTLSGGQRQRVALARAVLADPAVLLLDDATSAVDAETEEAINAALRTVLAGRTTVVTAHRRSTVLLADRVVLVDGGRVVDEGTHDALMARNELYRGLLTGLDEEPTDSIEELAVVTAGAWKEQPVAPRVAAGAPSLGAGLGGGGGGWRMNLAPTPELLAKVAALRPVRDHVSVDVAAEAARIGPVSPRSLVREFRRPLLVALVLVVLDALGSLAGPWLIRHGIDSGVLPGVDHVLWLSVALYASVVLLALLVGVAQVFVTGRLAQRVMLVLRVRVWAQLQRLSLDFYERELGGRIMTRMTTDVDQFEALVQNGLLSALVSLVTFVGVGVVLVVLDPELGGLTLSVVVPLAVATVWFRRRSAVLYELARDRIAVVNADFQESLSGVREAQAFGRTSSAIGRFGELTGRYLRARVAAQRLVALYFPFVQLLSAVADAIVLGVGAGLVQDGHLTAGALLAFLLYVDLFFSPIQQLSQVFDAWQQTRISLRRIDGLMGVEPTVPAPSEPVTPGRFAGAVRFADVRFSYASAPVRTEELRGPRDARPVVEVARRAPEALRGFALDIAAGETVALVGETGAGKSTVIKLLARLYDPTSGAITIDGTDLRTLDPSAFRQQLGFVPQEAFLFTGTVRDNIAYGRPSASDLEVEAAARAVGAHAFVAALPGGYRHQVAERGRSLSAGQRQLLALARAELVDPVVLLLDEATSNLDLVTEARVAAAMQRVTAGRTTLVIAHRLQTARGADRIAVLAAGRVVELGSHEDLLALGGRYAAMWAAFQGTAA
jgi:ATP-binding cassette subfamily B protein